MASKNNGKIPVSVLIMTRNEARRIERCLAALSDFDEIIVVDSGSQDATKILSEKMGAQVVDFAWNGRYPKKRQWCLENLTLAHHWVLFIDADEIVTPELIKEMRALDFKAAGYFIRGRYIFEGAVLRKGLRNNKLALIDRRKMEFPVVDDIGAPGMGEIEGHYQPVLKKYFSREYTRQLKNELLHDACDDAASWHERHARYAAWEIEMDRRKAWPQDPRSLRKILKVAFKASPARPLAAFAHCYILKLGFLDGARGFRFAKSRYDYYQMISAANKRAA